MYGSIGKAAGKIIESCKDTLQCAGICRLVRYIKKSFGDKLRKIFYRQLLHIIKSAYFLLVAICLPAAFGDPFSALLLKFILTICMMIFSAPAFLFLKTKKIL